MQSGVLVALTIGTIVTLVAPQAGTHRPLLPSDVDDIALLMKLEDTRRADAAALGRILQSMQPEVRRRAAISVGRIANRTLGRLLTPVLTDPDLDVAAAAVFATGQLKDPATVASLADTLSSPRTAPAVAREAAIALGKIQVPAARAALAAYLSAAPTTSAATPIVGEALLSIGRFGAGEDLAPITRWAASPDVEVRWRVAWALFRPRDPAALPHLLRLSDDASGDVRFWAVRGLSPPSSTPVNAAPQSTAPAALSDADGARIAARLRDAMRDPDRRVRTEALRALGQFDDDASFTAVLAEIENADSWMSASAAEAMGRFRSRAEIVVPKLIAAVQSGRPLALRVTALASVVMLAPEKALEVATSLARTDSIAARTAARQALERLGSDGQARLDALVSERVLQRAPPARPLTAENPKSDADYRRIVERWVVPDYNGAPKPRAIWEMAGGSVELELYPGDAPMGVDLFVRLVESGAIVGTEFTRVVPNFVAQQRAVRDDVTLRDEVNQRGLTRGNLSWASAGLDTGRPGYTLGSTPQPHNEGNFTALGRVVSGMDVVDRIELGDRITAARMRP